MNHVLIIVITNSKKDSDFMDELLFILRGRGMEYRGYCISAIRETGRLLTLLQELEVCSKRKIIITISRMGCSLPHLVTCHSRFPVIFYPSSSSPPSSPDRMITFQFQPVSPLMIVFGQENLLSVCERLIHFSIPPMSSTGGKWDPKGLHQIG